MHPAAASATTRLLVATTVLAVIELSELVVVVLDERVVRLELQGLFVRFARFLEAAELLVADAEVVPRRRVRRIDLDRPLPLRRRVTPEILLGDLDAVLDVLLGFRPLVGKQGRRERGRQ